MPDAIRSPIVLECPIGTDGPVSMFPFEQVTDLVWSAADTVADYCRTKGKADSAAEYISIEDLVNAICAVLEALDRFDPPGADHRAHQCSAGCPVETLHGDAP